MIKCENILWPEEGDVSWVKIDTNHVKGKWPWNGYCEPVVRQHLRGPSGKPHSAAAGPVSLATMPQTVVYLATEPTTFPVTTALGFSP